jgi:hypothetical protein
MIGTWKQTWCDYCHKTIVTADPKRGKLVNRLRRKVRVWQHQHSYEHAYRRDVYFGRVGDDLFEEAKREGRI